MSKEIKNTFIYQYFNGPKSIDYVALMRASLQKRFSNRKPVVAWFLCGDETVGSSRIHGLNISRELNRQGVASFIIQKPGNYQEELEQSYYTQKKLLKSRLDVVVFQRVHLKADEFVRKLQAAGTKTVYIMADYFETNMPLLCDHTIVVSDPLKQFLIDKGVSKNKIEVIPDAVETDHSICKNYDTEKQTKIRVVWVGNAMHWPTLDKIITALKEPEFADYELITISTHENSTIQWNLKTIWNDILRCDVAVVPAQTATKEGLAKSNNRVTMFKAIGLPVICSPLPMYKKVINHGVNGYIAESLDEWKKYMLLLKDEKVRMDVGLAGRDDIFKEYSLQNIGLSFKESFIKICG